MTDTDRTLSHAEAIAALQAARAERDEARRVLAAVQADANTQLERYRAITARDRIPFGQGDTLQLSYPFGPTNHHFKLKESALPVHTFRQKLVEVRAIRWTGDNLSAVSAGFPDLSYSIVGVPEGHIKVYNSNSFQIAHPGDWIVLHTDGSYHTWDPHTFAMTYDPVIEPGAVRLDSALLRNDIVVDQAPPKPTDHEPIWPLVIRDFTRWCETQAESTICFWPIVGDMRDRDELGRKRYGVPLTAHNGRNQLVDAYQEALDLAVYLRAALYEVDYDEADAAKLDASYQRVFDVIYTLRTAIMQHEVKP